MLNLVFYHLLFRISVVHAPIKLRMWRCGLKSSNILISLRKALKHRSLSFMFTDFIKIGGDLWRRLKEWFPLSNSIFPKI